MSVDKFRARLFSANFRGDCVFVLETVTILGLVNSPRTFADVSSEERSCA